MLSKKEIGKGASAVPSVQRRALAQAAALAGGVKELALRLGVQDIEVTGWLHGNLAIPTDVFLHAVDIVVAHSASELKRSISRTNQEPLDGMAGEDKPR